MKNKDQQLDKNIISSRVEVHKLEAYQQLSDAKNKSGKTPNEMQKLRLDMGAQATAEDAKV